MSFHTELSSKLLINGREKLYLHLHSPMKLYQLKGDSCRPLKDKRAIS